MISKNKNKSIPYQIFTTFGGKITIFTIFLFIFSIGCFVLDFLVLQPGCRTEFTIEEEDVSSNLNPSVNKEKNKLKITDSNSLPITCSFQQLFAFVYSSLLTSAITIFVIERFLRQDFAEELREQMLEISDLKILCGLIKKFHRDNNEYQKEIIDLIDNSRKGDEITLIGLNEEILMLRRITALKIKNKVESGIKFKILILDPNSDIVNSLKNTFDDSNKAGSYLSGDFNIVKSLYSELKGSINHDNKQIELKLKSDIYSPICYFSIKNPDNKEEFQAAFVWIYLFDKKSVKYPGFEIEDIDLFRDAEAHFNHLWEKSINYHPESNKDTENKNLI